MSILSLNIEMKLKVSYVPWIIGFFSKRKKDELLPKHNHKYFYCDIFERVYLLQYVFTVLWLECVVTLMYFWKKYFVLPTQIFSIMHSFTVFAKRSINGVATCLPHYNLFSPSNTYRCNTFKNGVYFFLVFKDILFVFFKERGFAKLVTSVPLSLSLLVLSLSLPLFLSPSLPFCPSLSVLSISLSLFSLSLFLSVISLSHLHIHV